MSQSEDHRGDRSGTESAPELDGSGQDRSGQDRSGLASAGQDSARQDTPELGADEPERGADLAAFWAVAKRHVVPGHIPEYFGSNPVDSLPPPTWTFGGTAEQADALLDLVLAGTKTATAGALWDYEAAGEQLPERGTLSIVQDGAGRPRALLVTQEVTVVAFEDVDAEHARLEGEGDRSLADWRRKHERFFTDFAEHDRGFAMDMPVVLERFAVLYQN